MQVFAGTYAMVKRWIDTKDAAGIKLCKELGWPIEIAGSADASSVPSLHAEAEMDS